MIERLRTVLYNIKILEKNIKSSNEQVRDWDCIIYAYAPRVSLLERGNLTYFWDATTELNALESYCSIVENPNALVVENLRMVQVY